VLTLISILRNYDSDLSWLMSVEVILRALKATARSLPAIVGSPFRVF
jgi:hypothetical protein